MGVEKVHFPQNSQDLGDRKCLGKLRKSFVGLSDAILFLRLSRERVFQHPQAITLSDPLTRTHLPSAGRDPSQSQNALRRVHGILEPLSVFWTTHQCVLNSPGPVVGEKSPPLHSIGPVVSVVADGNSLNHPKLPTSMLVSGAVISNAIS